jgi:phospholipid/cholesterol/gamma-HCH transport system substrate-binding protein
MRARVLVAAALAVAVIAIVVVATRSQGTYEVTAVFDNVRGLIAGGEVKAGGVNVGTVEDVGFTDDGVPQIRMRIDSDFPLRQGAFANIRLASNIGVINRFVDLTQGEGPELSDGATLGPSQTDQPVDLDLAVGLLDPKVRDAVGELLANVDEGTRGRGDDLARTLRSSGAALGETADLLREVTADQQALRTIVAQGRTVVGALASDPQSLGATAEHLATALDTAAAHQSELTRTAAAIGPALTTTRSTLQGLVDAMPALRDLVAASRPAVAELGPTAAALRPALTALRPLLDATRRLSGPLDEQLAALRPVIAAALPVTKRLPSVLSGLTPILDHLRARAPEVVGFFTLAGDATSDYDINGNLVRTSTVLIQDNGHPNIISSSSDEPGMIERPFDRDPGAAEGDPWARYWRSFIGGGKPAQSYFDDDEDSP